MTASIAKFPATQFVYVLGSPDGPQKIGIAIRPAERLALLQIGNHTTLRLHASVEVPIQLARSVERYAHWLLADSHIRGEWFDVSPPEAARTIATALKAIESGAAVPSSAKKTAPLSIRIEPELKSRLEKLAEAERRPLASYVEIALTDHADKAEALRKLK